jgi:hypothetical protein
VLLCAGCCQVDIGNGDLTYKWTVAAADEDSQQPADTDSAHYGIVLARMAGLPSHIITKAAQVAQQLQHKQLMQRQQRKLLEMQEGTHRRQLCQAYSLVHKLGCVARKAVADGMLPVQQDRYPPGVAAAVADKGDNACSDASAAPLNESLLPILKGLKQQAEHLLLEIA